MWWKIIGTLLAYAILDDYIKEEQRKKGEIESQPAHMVEFMAFVFGVVLCGLIKAFIGLTIYVGLYALWEEWKYMHNPAEKKQSNMGNQTLYTPPLKESVERENARNGVEARREKGEKLIFMKE